MGVEQLFLICFLTFFHTGKPILAGQSDAALGVGYHLKGCDLVYEDAHSPLSFCPPECDGDGKEST